VLRPARFCEQNDAGDLVFQVAKSARTREILAGLGLSRPLVHRVLANGALAGGADGRPLAPAATLEAGATVVLRPQATRAAGVVSNEPVAVLYEDPFVLAVEKPAGLLVHGDGTGAETLTARVQGLLRARGSDAVPQAVQRLDVQTTGVVLFSKTEEFQGLFDALVAGGGLRKRYLALCEGVVEPRPFSCREPLARDRHDARRMRVCAPGTGQGAWTDAARLEAAPDGSCSLVALELHTGRKHQIRVHMAHRGHAVVNDGLYGRVSTPDGLMLHALEERFVHPVTGAEVVVRAPWPARFCRWFCEREV
jgi:23S rRNA pseudouridine1911/1915/1917 synthase